METYYSIFHQQWKPLQVRKQNKTLVVFLKLDTLEISRQTVQSADDRFYNKHQMIEGPMISLGNMRFMIMMLNAQVYIISAMWDIFFGIYK